MQAARLPAPLPKNGEEYVAWRERAMTKQEVDEDDEDAWFELDRILATEPAIGWRLLTELAARCTDEDTCSQIAAGPLSTFLRKHREAFSSEIEEELMVNAGFRNAYTWLQV